MNLINLLCLIFLCLTFLTSDITSRELIIAKSGKSRKMILSSTALNTTSDKITLIREPAVASSDFFSSSDASLMTSDKTTLSTEPGVTSSESFSSSDASLTPSYSDDVTDTTTEVLPHDTPLTSETESTTEALVTKEDFVGKENHILLVRGNFQHGGTTQKPSKPLSPDNDNESALSKGKVAVILVSSCIIAVALIWISKIIYTRCHSQTYDLRQDIKMGNL